MTERELETRLQQLEAQVQDLRRQLAHVPARYSSGGGGGDSLPPGKGQYKVLMRLDDLEGGAVGWDWPRFH